MGVSKSEKAAPPSNVQGPARVPALKPAPPPAPAAVVMPKRKESTTPAASSKKGKQKVGVEVVKEVEVVKKKTVEDVLLILAAHFQSLVRALEGNGKDECPSWLDAYTMVYDLCTDSETTTTAPALLFEAYVKQLEEYLTNQVLSCIQEKYDVFMLKEVIQKWSTYQALIKSFSYRITYLNRYYLKDKTQLIPKGKEVFQELVFHQVKGKMKDTLLGMITLQRDGEEVDRTLMKASISLFVEMGLNSYEKDFEEFMLEKANDYYSRKGTVWLAEFSCADYMAKVEEILKLEKGRVENYMQSSSDEKLAKIVEEQLLLRHQAELLDKALLVLDEKMEDVARMYRMFHRMNKLVDLSAAFKKHVQIKGLDLVKEADNAARNKKSEPTTDAMASQEHRVMENLIDLYQKYTGYVENCFSNDELFQKAIKDVFPLFCNKSIGSCSMADIFATFCDNILKKGSGFEEAKIEQKLDRAMMLLTFLHDKDVFVEFSKKKLSRRLLFAKSESEDLERSFLSKLKQKFGGQLTSKMEGMLTDLTLAKEKQEKFEAYLKANPDKHPGVAFNLTLLSTGPWPSYSSADIVLPQQMGKCVERYQEYQNVVNPKMKVTVIYSLGTCHIMGKFETKEIEIILSTYQAALLMLFEKSDKLSFEEIKSKLGMIDEDVIRLLHSLSCLKHKILVKTPNSRSVDKKDVFEFNTKFTDKTRRIRIPLPPTSVQEKKKVIEDVGMDRKAQVDATIVRIMKARKQLEHQQLMSETIEQLQKMFMPDPKMLKKRIEELITREFLERDKVQPNLFRYLA